MADAGEGAASTNFQYLQESQLNGYIQNKNQKLVAKIFLKKNGDNWEIDNTAADNVIPGSISLPQITKRNITEIQGEIMQILNNNNNYEAETIMLRKDQTAV